TSTTLRARCPARSGCVARRLRFDSVSRGRARKHDRISDTRHGVNDDARRTSWISSSAVCVSSPATTKDRTCSSTHCSSRSSLSSRWRPFRASAARSTPCYGNRLPAVSEAIVVCTVVASVGASAVVDVYTRRVPNPLTLGIAAVGVAMAATHVSGVSVVGAFAGFALGLLLMLPGHLIGATGGGDVKL